MKELYTIDDFCRMYSISRTQVYRLLNRGQLKAVKMGKATRIHRKDAEAWADSLQEV